jgi:flagellar biosynthesis anti-sigma factor FlgM
MEHRKVATMRIDSSSLIQKVSSISKKGVGEVEAPGAAGTDSVELSARAADFRTALEALASVPTVREERVAELRSQFEQGILLTDGDSLAAKLLKKS